MKGFLLLVVLTLISVGCAVGPNFHAPAPPATPSYTPDPLALGTISSKGKGGSAQHFLYGLDIPGIWWALFRCQPLNDLIDYSIAHNANIQAAQAALREAQENQRAEIGALFPLVTASFSDTRERFAGSEFGQNTPGSVFSVYTPLASASYTLDVFGGIRRQIEALGAQADYQRYELTATYLTLTANVVTTAVTIASLREQIEATQQLIDGESKLLTLISKQLALGAVARTSVLLQQAQLAQTIASLPPLMKNLTISEHSLAVLMGRLPSETYLPAFSLNEFHLPTQLPVSLPSRLVAQRPDVQASLALLHAASANIGVATANMLPQFTITGYYGSMANHWNQLFDPETIVWNITGQVMQTVFNAGTLSAQRRAAIAAYQQAAAQYKQTVLQAFQNVADSLRALQIDAQALRAETQAENSARAVLHLTQGQYRLGGANYLDLLTAQVQYQQARLGRIQAQASRYADTATLFQALGGGWWNVPAIPPSTIPETPLEKVLGVIL